MVIPIVASFAAAGSAIAAAGGVMAALGTVSGFLSVAGAALTGIGALTGKKDLVKVGGLMSLGGSVVSGFSGAAASEAAGQAAGDAASEQAAQEGFRALEHADAAGAAADTAGQAAGTAGADAAGQMAGTAATQPQSLAGLDQAVADASRAGVQAADIDPLQRANQLFEASPNGASQSASPSIFDSAKEAFRRGEIADGSIYSRAIPPSGVTINGQVFPVGSQSGAQLAAQTGRPDVLAESARSMTGDQVDNLVQRGDVNAKAMLGNSFRRAEILDTNAMGGGRALVPSGVTINGQVMSTAEPTLFERAMGLAKDFGGYLERNPGLATVGAKAIAGAFGPDAEELDWRKSIWARRMANLNRPVALTFGKG